MLLKHHIAVFLQFSRTVAPVHNKGSAVVALMKHHNWTKIVVLTSTGVHVDSGSRLTYKLKNASMEVFKPRVLQYPCLKAILRPCCN